MTRIFSIDNPLKLTADLKTELENKVFISATDTVFGLTATASNPHAPSLLKKLKGSEHEHFLRLTDSIARMEKQVEWVFDSRKIVETYWPGPFTFILPSAEDPHHTLAFRCPNSKGVHNLIQAIGEPLLSTSCNPHGKPPAQTLDEARDYFEHHIDLFFDSKQPCETIPSALVNLCSNKPQVLRVGPREFVWPCGKA